jgi:CRP-like cAMP-binding protein
MTTRQLPDLSRPSLSPPRSPQLTMLDLVCLGAAWSERTYPAGALIFHRGDAPARVHAVLSGAVELLRQQPRHRVAIAVVRRGDVFGDVSVLAGVPQPFDARALLESRVASIASVDFLRNLRERPQLAQRWLAALAVRTNHLQRRLMDVLAGPIEQRVALLLLSEAADGEVPLGQALIAQLLGIHRSSVNRVLKEFEAAGLVTLGYRRIRLHNMERLQRLTGSTSPPSG